MAASVGIILTGFVYIVFACLMAIQRSHDMGWSGWTIPPMVVPIVGLFWIFKAGSEGANRYGAPPPPNTWGVHILGVFMPLLAAIGILAAIARPAHQQYQMRAKAAQVGR